MEPSLVPRGKIADNFITIVDFIGVNASNLLTHRHLGVTLLMNIHTVP